MVNPLVHFFPFFVVTNWVSVPFLRSSLCDENIEHPLRSFCGSSDPDRSTPLGSSSFSFVHIFPLPSFSIELKDELPLRLKGHGQFPFMTLTLPAFPLRFSFEVSLPVFALRRSVSSLSPQSPRSLPPPFLALGSLCPLEFSFFSSPPGAFFVVSESPSIDWMMPVSSPKSSF